MDWRGAPKGAPSLYAALVSVISGRIACRTSSETVVSRRCAAAFSDCRSAGLRRTAVITVGLDWSGCWGSDMAAVKQHDPNLSALSRPR
jgi:hypothetical protein